MRRPNFTLLSETEVLHAVKHDDGKTVKGVKFITKEGVEGFQPADVVCITTYQMDNVRLMLLSRVGEQYAPPHGPRHDWSQLQLPDLLDGHRLLRRQLHEPLHWRRRPGGSDR